MILRINRIPRFPRHNRIIYQYNGNGVEHIGLLNLNVRSERSAEVHSCFLYLMKRLLKFLCVKQRVQVSENDVVASYNVKYEYIP